MNLTKFDEPFQEVLRYGSVKLRADAMSHFIRVAKRLHELNNLNAEYAIVSALQSAPIYRLGHTWASLSRKVMNSQFKQILLNSSSQEEAIIS